MKDSLAGRFISARLRYLRLILRLMKAGNLDLLESQIETAASLDDWTTDELEMLIAEGRRRRDNEEATLRDIRSRSQLVLSTALVVLAALATQTSGFVLRWPTAADFFIGFGFLAGSAAALGAAAVVVVAAPMGVVDLPGLTTVRAREEGMARALADQYLDIESQNRSVVRTFHVAFFESVIWLLLAAGCAVGGFF